MQWLCLVIEKHCLTEYGHAVAQFTWIRPSFPNQKTCLCERHRKTFMTDSSPPSPENQSPLKKIMRGTWPIIGLILVLGVAFAWRQWQYNLPESHYQRAREALQAGDDDVVLQEAENLSQKTGFESHSKLLRGLLLVRKGKLTEALTQLKQANADTTVVEASANAAKCFYQLGQYLNAIEAAHSALARDPGTIDARRWLAAAYYDLGAVGHAVVELEQISREATDDPRPDRLLGLIAKDSEQYLKAIGHYRESLHRDPKQPDREKIHNELADSLIKQNLFEDALSVLKDCQRSASVLTLEADCQYSLGESAKAHNLLNQAMELDPKYVPARLTKGKLLLDAGEADKALMFFKDAVRLDPFNRVTHLQLSQAFRQLGQSEQADKELQRSNEIKSREREFTDLHETAMLKPLDADVRFRLGELAGQLGKRELSKMWLRAALAINPQHEKAQTAVRLDSTSPDGENSTNHIAELTPLNPGYQGPESCIECHADRVAEFQTTRHFLANQTPQSGKMPEGFSQGKGTYQVPEHSLHFEMTESPHGFLATAIQQTAKGNQATSSKIAFCYGSAGGNDEIYFAWREDRLYELPVAWLDPNKEWGSSLFDRHGSGDFSREMTIRCVECHNTWFEHFAGTRNRYGHDNFILGVTCEVCHGPGQDHVTFHRNNREIREAYAVARPTRMTREQRMDLCAQCHSNALKHRGPAFSYRPGQPLDESYVTLKPKHPEEDHVANQTTYLRQSRCFQQSDSLTCVTCHNPHQPRSATNAGSASCKKCHADKDCTDRNQIPTEVQHNCVGCHMPEGRKIQVFFRTETDNYVAPVKRFEHRIAVYPAAKSEVLLEWHRSQSEPQNREEVARLSKWLGEYWRKESENLHSQSRYLAAINACRESLRFAPDPDMKVKLEQMIKTQTGIDTDLQDGLWHERNRRYDQAIEAFQRVLAAKPAHVMALGKLGTNYAVVGKKQLAFESLKAAAASDPDDPYAPGMLGWLAYLDGQFEVALEHFREADAVEPYSAKIHYQMGLALEKLSRRDEAIQQFTKAVEIDPNDVNASRAKQRLLGTDSSKK